MTDLLVKFGIAFVLVLVILILFGTFSYYISSKSNKKNEKIIITPLSNFKFILIIIFLTSIIYFLIW